MQSGRVIDICKHASDTGHDSSQTHDGVKSGDHLWELNGCDTTTNDSANAATHRCDGSDLNECLGIEADSVERDENTGH